MLPEDLKAFLQITNGLNLKWDAKLNGEIKFLFPKTLAAATSLAKWREIFFLTYDVGP